MTLPDKIVEKVNFLLTRFKNTEWSGPAWYQIIKREKNGFPSEVSLQHFVAIDLGDGTATEVDGEKLGKILPKIYKMNAHLKDAYLGLIHSHHKMGAFFSGTDESTALEQAPTEGLFFTTVVASNKEKYCTGVSYRDHFGFPNFVEGDVETDYKMDVPKEWEQEANRIEKAHEKANKISYVRGNQLHILGQGVGNHQTGTPGYQHGGYYNGYYDEIPGVSDTLPKKLDDQNVAIALPSKISSVLTKV